MGEGKSKTAQLKSKLRRLFPAGCGFPAKALDIRLLDRLTRATFISIMSLTNKVVIVTGAGSPIGIAYVRALLEAGASVVLADIEDLAKAKEVSFSKGRAIYVKTDVRYPEEVEAMVKKTVDTFGKVDVLINSAALFSKLKRQPLEDLYVEEWEHVLLVNVIGPFNCVKAVVPFMKKQGSGKIINVATNAVHKGLPQLLHYVSSKGAVIAMTRSLARELGPFGITVNAIAPGYILHPGTITSDEGRDEKVKALRSIPKSQTPEDLVGTIIYLSSPASDFVTGQTLLVDGGEVFV
jgi:NAD(P)-dependent dehydrogenase (short-subunit alcohol dehydrogenase family)